MLLLCWLTGFILFTLQSYGSKEFNIDGPSPSFTILNENDLEPNTTESSDSFILIKELLTYNEAVKACDKIGESIAFPETFDTLSRLARKHYNSQNDIYNDKQFWIKSSPPMVCKSFSLTTNSSTSDNNDCESSYHEALCTNTAPIQTSYKYPSRDKSVLVNLNQNNNKGTIKGFRDRLVARFNGIPFAKPPIDDLRFQAPQPVAINQIGTQEPYDATYPRAMCMQDPPSSPSENNTMSEDCLYLNIYTPYIPNNQTQQEQHHSLLPTIIYYHGGAYLTGSSVDSTYLGMNLASRENVVVVGVNYRVGILGFYTNDTESDQVSTNAGMRDQIASLKWVHSNIEKFGGDKNQITIVGESAGATTIVSLLQTKETRGLFSKAVVESPNLLSGWQRPNVANKISKMFFDLTGCHDIKCLKHDIKNATKFIEYQNQVFKQAQDTSPVGLVDVIEPVRPWIDNDLLYQDWEIEFESGNFNQVPVLITYNKDEYTAFLADSQESFGEKGHEVTFDEAKSYFETYLLGPELTSKLVNSPILGFNSKALDNVSDVSQAEIDFTTDLVYRCSGEMLANYTNMYVDHVYELTWQMSLPQSVSTPACQVDGRICHSAELPLVFGTGIYLDAKNISVQQLEQENYWHSARQSMDLYGHFFHSHASDNTPSMLPGYPKRQHGNHNVLHWSNNPTVIPGGVRWDQCQEMKQLKLYARQQYPYTNQ